MCRVFLYVYIFRIVTHIQTDGRTWQKTNQLSFHSENEREKALFGKWQKSYAPWPDRLPKTFFNA